MVELNDTNTHNLFFVFRSIPSEDAAAWSKFLSWIKTPIDVPDDHKLPDEVLRLYAGFYLQFPKLFPSRKRRIQIQHDPGSLSLFPVSDSISMICIPPEHLAQLLPFGLWLAHSLGVTVFDSNTRYIHRIDGIATIRMTLENQTCFSSPSLRQIATAVDTLTPMGAPSFMILDGPGQNYAQAAGGKGKLTCEWREYSDGTFRHWIAGTSDPVKGEVRIATNGFHVMVNSNECLSIADVKSILTAFARDKPRPRKWVWRDVTDRFR